MDQQLLGEATVKLMESLEKEGKFDEAKMIAVGITVIMEMDDGDGKATFTRTYSTEDIYHRALGLFEEGYLTIRASHSNDPDFEDDDDQEFQEGEDE